MKNIITYFNKINPFIIYAIWTLLCLCGFFMLLIIPEKWVNDALSAFLDLIAYSLIGTFIISVITSLNFKWMKQYWGFNLTVFVLFGFAILYPYFKNI